MAVKMRYFLNVIKISTGLRFKRDFSNGRRVIVEQLTHRSLLKITGNDSTNLLQSLTTNDIRHLQHQHQPQSCLYSLFLNTKGRVVLDAIIYCLKKPNEYYIESDQIVSDLLENHLKFYRLRKKVDFIRVSDRFRVWQIFSEDCDNLGEIETSSNCYYFSDPRLKQLGLRVISPIGETFDQKSGQNERLSYKKLRYQLGVGEGADDFVPEKCLPFETNCDFLNAISLDKGCYLGQELTARSYHTGVIRKRLMPIISNQKIDFEPEEPVIADGKEIGKLKSIFDNSGLAVVKVAEALKAKQLSIKHTPIQIQVPDWWPKQY